MSVRRGKEVSSRKIKERRSIKTKVSVWGLIDRSQHAEVDYYLMTK